MKRASASVMAGDWRAGQVLSMSEEYLQSQIIELAKALRWVYYHPFDSRRSVAGFPDLVLVHPVRRLTLFRELKTSKGKVSAAQVKWLDDLRAAGNDVGVWRPSDLLDNTIIDELKGRSHA